MTCFSIPLHVPVLPQQIEPPAKPDTLQESSTIINRLWSTRVPEKKYWLQDPIFRDLCDLVASSRIICMTGAGISSALKCRHIPGHLLTWPKLLEQLYHEFHDQLDPEVRSDIQQLIRGNSTGDELIEAASCCAALRKSSERIPSTTPSANTLPPFQMPPLRSMNPSSKSTPVASSPSTTTVLRKWQSERKYPNGTFYCPTATANSCVQSKPLTPIPFFSRRTAHSTPPFPSSSPMNPTVNCLLNTLSTACLFSFCSPTIIY